MLEDFLIIFNVYSTWSSSTGELTTTFNVVSSSGVGAVNVIVPVALAISPTSTFALLDVGVITTSASVASVSIHAMYSSSSSVAFSPFATIESIVNKYFLIIVNVYCFSVPFSACTVIITVFVSSGIETSLVVLFTSI